MTTRQRWFRYGTLAVAIVLVFGLVGSSAGGQAPDERDARIAELEKLVADRDTLVAAQEMLLNEYRCLFNVDTQLVPNGCTNSAPTQPTPSQPTQQPTAADLPAGTTEEQWEQLRQCNADGNYQYANPNGTNFGAYEFRRTSWNDLARRHYPRLIGVVPNEAAPADQDRMAYALYEERGWAPWPSCRPSPQPGDATPADPTSFPPIPAGTTQAQWDQLVRCESQGNYRAYSSVGPFLGAFQFLQSTWNWVAGIHYPRLVGVDPRDAAPIDQHRMAYALYGMQGWRPWPACTAAFRQ
ncbi:transglycosylase family protein [Candidatus Poriferisocius sp.]|uniref:transglycosylase family protein n=1 Tax=Candidatus Poriferisocius sp. TaxID=3101276 RepID=UPI003B01C41E